MLDRARRVLALGGPARIHPAREGPWAGGATETSLPPHAASLLHSLRGRNAAWAQQERTGMRPGSCRREESSVLACACVRPVRVSCQPDCATARDPLTGSTLLSLTTECKHSNLLCLTTERALSSRGCWIGAQQTALQYTAGGAQLPRVV